MSNDQHDNEQTDRVAHRRFHVGHIEFGPTIEVLPPKEYSPGKGFRTLRFLPPPEAPFDLSKREATLREELETLRAERSRLLQVLLSAEGALTMAAVKCPGDTLYGFVRDRIRLVLNGIPDPKTLREAGSPCQHGMESMTRDLDGKVSCTICGGGSA